MNIKLFLPKVKFRRWCSVGVLWKKLFLKTLQFYRKTPVVESLFNKVTGILASNLNKKRLHHRCFPVKFTKFLRTPILKNICERLLHKILSKTLLMSKNHNVVILQRMNGLILLYSDSSLTCYWRKNTLAGLSTLLK